MLLERPLRYAKIPGQRSHRCVTHAHSSRSVWENVGVLRAGRGRIDNISLAMACVTLIPGNSDRNDGIVEELRARPGASSQPTAPAKPSAPRLLRGSRKMVTVKVEPSYVSSDLFTPFSEPRSTLPSIG